MASFAQYGPGKEEFPVNASRGILRRNTVNDGWEEKLPENILNDAAASIDINGQKLTNVGAPTPGTTDVATAGYADSVGVNSINLAAFVQLTSGLASGTSQPLSLADSIFTGQIPGGSTNGEGALGVIAVSFDSLANETGTGVGQGGFGSAPAMDQPYNSTDFPGQHVEVGLLRADGAAVSVSDIVAVPAPGQGGQEVEAYLSYRSDLGANLKWRLWFFYRRTADGFHVSITPDVSIPVSLYAPIVSTLADLPVGFGLGKIAATPGAAGVVPGILADIQSVNSANAAGVSGRVADAAHAHAHGSHTVDTNHALAVAGVSHGFLDKADKTKLDGLPATAPPTTRTITAGNGLTGGGDLSANRTLDVVANADGSITVNVDDIQVGVLATDAQHGVRGGATQHASVTQAVNGFMVASDKIKIDNIASDTINVTTQTVNAVPFDLTAYTPTDGKAVTLNLTVTARKSDGTASGHFQIVGGFRRTGGTVTQEGATQIPAYRFSAGLTTLDVTFSITGTAINVRMTGVLATTIDWRAQGTVVTAP